MEEFLTGNLSNKQKVIITAWTWGALGSMIYLEIKGQAYGKKLERLLDNKKCRSKYYRRRNRQKCERIINYSTFYMAPTDDGAMASWGFRF